MEEEAEEGPGRSAAVAEAPLLVPQQPIQGPENWKFPQNFYKIPIYVFTNDRKFQRIFLNLLKAFGQFFCEFVCRISNFF